MYRLSQVVFAGLLALLPLVVPAETVIPVGVLYLGEESILELPLHNDSASPMRIDRAETSCDCLVPRFGATEIPAGETRLFAFTYRSTAVGQMRVDINYFNGATGTMLMPSSISGHVTRRDWIHVRDRSREPDPTGELWVIDLRPAERFEQVHVPRSLNIPAFALKLRKDLKPRKLILIDEGFSPNSIAEEAQRLRHSGFQDVSVFDGGLAAWIRQGGRVEGVSQSATAAARITPAEYLRSQAKGPWKVVSLSAGAAKSTAIAEAVQAGRISSRVLIIAESDAEYAVFEKQSVPSVSPPLFYLAGGPKALTAYKVEQERMAANPGAVFQSKSMQPHVVATSGCGTCPK